LAALVLSGQIELWMLYLMALVFGLADAFFFPAQMSILPRILSSDMLLAGNSLAAGTIQLSIAVGPALAGLLIAVFSGRPEGASILKPGPAMTGLGLAFGINAACFLASIPALLLVRLSPTNGSEESQAAGSGVILSIAQGLRYIFTDKTLRLLLIVTAASHFFIEGPIFVGVPVLAETRFTQGAAAFGAIISALGAGLLMGTILAGTLPRLPARRMGMVLLLIISATGLLLMLFGFAGSTEVAAMIVLAMGLAQGYVAIQYSTWIQSRTPSELLGRVFGMMMFASIGLIPVSQALTGVLIKVHTLGLFLGAGSLLTIIVFLVAIRPEVRSMGLAEKKKDRPGPLSPA
jgi:MFS family permease